ncbi:nuclear transcription factor Y subunit A-7-like [Zingiber officinale]|uniref:nuclear transcription factor Y subunit A-7-like n=1 Tax=Zingiber officinale TaxID=94328 RepID=UPI001C4C7643|nr:nuclear transcription factor Y subunit A-7-like [Zingiber officinale]XP_042420660.1 nuclear transcription factor Y subunit A-7-like [Zingiber officinale]XP_042420661.1 nuclear transcription factor Y subunit A-7-like [Zingiber officinale]
MVKHSGMESRPNGTNPIDLSNQTALPAVVSAQPWWCTPLFAAGPASKPALAGDEVAEVHNINGVDGTDGNLGDKDQSLQPTSSAMAPVMPEIIAPQLELGQSLACATYPYNDPYFAGLVATYGAQSLVHPQIIGIPHSRMALPLEMAEEPVYVNAKQYHGILRRRQSRAKAELEKKATKARKPYLHESRHLHAVRRARGCGGRFLNTKKTDEGTAKTETQTPTRPIMSSNSLTSDGSGNTNPPSSIQEATPELKMITSTKDIYQEKSGSQFAYHLKPGEKTEVEDCLRQQHVGILMNQPPNWAVTIQ